jgi:hypothetical protein
MANINPAPEIEMAPADWCAMFETKVQFAKDKLPQLDIRIAPPESLAVFSENMQFERDKLPGPVISVMPRAPPDWPWFLLNTDLSIVSEPYPTFVCDPAPAIDIAPADNCHWL